MIFIIDTNEEIIYDIREIYHHTPCDKLRNVIAKHFIPSMEEKKQNAEVSTPVELVNDMLDKMPSDFWTEPRSVFEPCCGKGNFVLAIFERFNEGLKNMFPDNEERCRIIIDECLYYADLTPLNVFITTVILKCNIESICGIEPDYEFHSHTGDTLKLDIEKEWGLDGFEAIIGNPPYQIKVGERKTHPIWNLFVKTSIDNLTEKNGYLLMVHPSGWRSPEGVFKDVFNKIMSKDLKYLNMNDFKKGQELFHVGTNFDYYLLQNTNTIDNITKIVDIRNKNYELNLKKWDFIPSGGFELYEKILCKDDEDNVCILHDYSIYETRKPYLSTITK